MCDYRSIEIMSDEVKEDDVPKENPRKASPEEGQLDPSESFHLALGFFGFGFAISWTAGLTAQAGSGTTMLTGFFAFVGGAFVSFSGFQMSQRLGGKRAEETPEPPPPRINPGRFGRSLGALSLGIVLGGPAAYLTRTSVLAEPEASQSGQPDGEESAAPDEGSTKAGGYVYQADVASACKYAAAATRGRPNKKVVANALASLLESCTEAEECQASAAALVEALERTRVDMCTGDGQ